MRKQINVYTHMYRNNNNNNSNNNNSNLTLPPRCLFFL